MPDWYEEKAREIEPMHVRYDDRVVAKRKEIASALREAAAREREECAKVAEELPADHNNEFDTGYAQGRRIAAAIRARGEG